MLSHSALTASQLRSMKQTKLEQGQKGRLTLTHLPSYQVSQLSQAIQNSPALQQTWQKSEIHPYEWHCNTCVDTHAVHKLRDAKQRCCLHKASPSSPAAHSSDCSALSQDMRLLTDQTCCLLLLRMQQAACLITGEVSGLPAMRMQL